MNWVKGLFWQPAKDARLTRVEDEVSAIKTRVDQLQEEMANLQTFRSDHAAAEMRKDAKE